MRILKLPNVGYRNIKTALAVLICLLFLNKSLMAAIAAIICMQSTIEDSVTIGVNRLIGTLLGGLLGIVIIHFISLFNLHNYSIFISALSVSLVIYICNLIKKPAACVIAAIVVLGIIMDPSVDNQISYALSRTLETSLGVIIAILVNRFINPPTDCEDKENDLNLHQTAEINSPKSDKTEVKDLDLQDTDKNIDKNIENKSLNNIDIKN